MLKISTKPLNEIWFFRLGLVLLFFFTTTGSAPAQNSPFPFPIAETITYTIKKFGVKVGEATLTLGGLEKVEARDLYRMTFTAKAPNFFDQEQIWVEPATLYPVLVKRNLNIFGKKEKIIEKYDLAKGEIKIRKEAGGKISEQIITDKRNVDNIYCFLYRFRMRGEAKKGSTFMVQLPTKNVRIDVRERTQLKIAKRSYEAIYLESNPREYKMWFDTSARMIPLRIDGAMGIASTSLVIEGYRTP